MDLLASFPPRKFRNLLERTRNSVILAALGLPSFLHTISGSRILGAVQDGTCRQSSGHEAAVSPVHHETIFDCPCGAFVLINVVKHSHGALRNIGVLLP